MSRLGELFVAFDAAESELIRYQEDVTAEHPPARFWESITSLFSVWDSGGAPSCFSNRLITAINGLKEIVRVFDDTMDLDPPQRFFNDLALVIGDRKAIPDLYMDEKHFLPMSHYQKTEGMTHADIARKFGLVNAHRTPNVAAVAKELETPGSIITKDWVHPLEKTRIAKREKLVADLSEAEKWMDDYSDKAQEQAATVKHFTDDQVVELFYRGVTDVNAVRTSGRPMDEINDIYTKCALEGRPLHPVVEEEVELFGDETESKEFRKLSDEQLREWAQGLGIAATKNYKRSTLVTRISQYRDRVRQGIA